MRKLAIIHFSAIESYPPVMNWLNFLAGRREAGFEVRVFTLRPGGGVTPFKTEDTGIRIFRSGRPGMKRGYAWLHYLAYYVRTIFVLIRWRPDTVLYYETLSSLPALFYKRVIKRDSSLFIHYHEYSSEKEYEQGMVLGKWLHKIEKRYYPLADWISHTNEDRIRLFRNDVGGIDLPPVHVLPNYPPVSWQSVSRAHRLAGRAHAAPGIPVKIVYVGALSLDTMYTKEFSEWVQAQSGRVIWDIYTDNATTEARNYIASFEDKLIRCRAGVNYYSLPDILNGYDIGVILYKGHIPNYVYNAPNKLFEYMDCGLDTWFPGLMEGIHPYITAETYPKVLPLDFERLRQWDFSAAIDRSGLEYASSEFYAEQVLPALLQKMRELKK